MRNTQPFYTVFRVLKVYISYKNSYIRYIQHQFFYFLLFYVSFYISRYHFVQLFKTSINIALTKKLVRFYRYPHKKVSQDLTEKKQDFTEMSIILMVLTEI